MLLVPSNADLSAAVMDRKHKEFGEVPEAHEAPEGRVLPEVQMAMEYEKEKVATWRESPAMSKSDHTTAPASDTSTQTSPTLARTLVLHAAPTKFKPGQIRRWIEEDNKATAVQILGIRWLTQEHRGASHGKKNLAHHRIRLVQMRLWRNSHSSIIVF
ncbi:hypothetical protein BGX38DRAFT_1143587 [Terfezia claveryi]|nr:hypothetical protein BGX38DRAFT_1143587 [Terfezia claveryi]